MRIPSPAVIAELINQDEDVEGLSYLAKAEMTS